jgi:hypothetical protein
VRVVSCTQDACEGKDLERVRAAVEDIRHATRAASLSPDARRARAIRGSSSSSSSHIIVVIFFFSS